MGSNRQTAIVLAPNALSSPQAKVAHGLIRHSERFAIGAIIDDAHAGEDAADLFDGVAQATPVFASVEDALGQLDALPQWCIVGVATHGGRLTQVLQDLLQAAAEHGIGLINGLHEPLAKHPTISAICRANHCEIIDLRRPKALAELHFWNGSIRQVKAPRIAVIGTDCALGKRTTARLLTNALNQNHLKTEMIYTGQTGWLQGGRYGFILDSTLNDFVSGELEHAIVRCDREVSPDLILLEGQSALRNPSGPCGAELLVSGEAKGTILQYAPMRRYFEGYESERLAIPSIQSEIELIAHYGSQVLGIAINRENMPDDALRATQQRLEDTLSVPVVCPLTDGVGPLIAPIRAFVETQTR